MTQSMVDKHSYSRLEERLRQLLHIEPSSEPVQYESAADDAQEEDETTSGRCQVSIS